jgi:hypothetical protein
VVLIHISLVTNEAKPGVVVPICIPSYLGG